jgi:hypothetical protein
MSTSSSSPLCPGDEELSLEAPDVFFFFFFFFFFAWPPPPSPPADPSSRLLANASTANNKTLVT